MRDRKTARYLAFDDTMQLSGWRNIKTGDEIAARNMQNCSLLAFSGIQLIEPAIFKMITESGSFPLIPLYLRLAAEHRIMGYNDPSSLWMDLGKPSQILNAEKYIV
jgi:NDP-sugar pyrophosphorylase family protein